jgi:hypothetical protein
MDLPSVGPRIVEFELTADNDHPSPLDEHDDDESTLDSVEAGLLATLARVYPKGRGRQG